MPAKRRYLSVFALVFVIQALLSIGFAPEADAICGDPQSSEQMLNPANRRFPF